MLITSAPKLIGACALAIGVMGVVAPPQAAHAAGCTDWVFNGNTTVRGSPDWAWTITFASDNKVVPGSVDFHKPPASDASDGPASGAGGIDGSNMHMVLNGIQFNGKIDDNGFASGGTIFPTQGQNPPTWTIDGPLKCNTPEKTAPDHAVHMNIDKGPLTATVTVNNTSDMAGKCNYDATGTSGVFAPPLHRDFNIAPNGTNTFDVPAPPLGSSYHVVLSCKGDFQGKQIEFGHEEQEVSSF
jgi:hypothetical protein